MTEDHSAPREKVVVALGVGLVALASRLPFISLGYALDGDAWFVARAAKHIAETKSYVHSRPPGFPLHEFMCAIVWPLGPLASNGLTAVVSAIAAALFALLVKRMGASARISALAGIALAFVPIIYVNSTVTLDYLWALAGILAALLAAHHHRPAVAGLCLGAAIGCRITSGAMILPVALVLFFQDPGPRRRRQLGVFVCSTLLTGALLYAPVVLTYGFGFLRFIDVALGPASRARLTLYGGTIGVWGALGAIGLGVGILVFAANPARSLRNAALSGQQNKWVLAASLAAIMLFTISFVRFPIEYAYLIPAVPFALLLLLFLVHRTVSTGILILMILSPFLVHVDFSLSASARGFLLDDADKRRDQMHYLAFAYADILGTPAERITAVTGTETKKFEVLPPILASLDFSRPVTLVRDLKPADMRDLLAAGEVLYFVHKGVFHVDQGYVVEPAESGGLRVRIRSYPDRAGDHPPGFSPVTACHSA